MARDGPAPHHDPYPKTDAENIASICPSLQINEINISRLPCSNRDRRFLIIFSATPRFSAAGLATFLYDLEFFIWNWRRASMASELGSADPLLDMLAERGVTWPGLPVLLPLPAPSPAPSSLMEQNIFVNNKYFSSDAVQANILCYLMEALRGSLPGAREDFLLLRHAARGSLELSRLDTHLHYILIWLQL